MNKPRYSMRSARKPGLLPGVGAQGWLLGGAVAVLLGLAGCAVEVQNTKPAQELARAAKPPGSLYIGWRVYQDKCADCHGPTATGGTGGPDLLPRLRTMGSRQFVGLVLDRYDWTLPPGKAGTAHEVVIDDIVQFKEGTLTMPAWQGEPRVNAHIMDLYAYLSARAQGAQGPNRPPP